jgi:hypothetical protein
VADNDPSQPLGDADSEAEHSSAPDDPDTDEAILGERGPGAHEEHVGDDQLREDETAPGVDPDEADA